MYLIHGKDAFLNNLELRKILKKQQHKTVIFFNDDSQITNIIDELNGFDLFGEEKIIVWKNSPLLNLIKDNKNDVKSFVDFLKNNKINNDIIFYSNEIVKSKNTELTEYLFKYAHIIEARQLSQKEIPYFIKKIIESKKGTISIEDATLISNKISNNNLSIIYSEIEKILAQSLEVNSDIINSTITSYNENDPFSFINSFASLNAQNIIENFQQRIANGDNVINLIGQMASTLILCSKIYTLQKAKYSKTQIENNLKIHPYRIKLASDFLNLLGIDKLNYLIKKLTQLDKDIKTGKIDEEMGFNVFLLAIFE